MANYPANISLDLSATPCLEAEAYFNYAATTVPCAQCVTIRLRWRNGYALVHLTADDAGRLADTLGAASIECGEKASR